MRCLLILFFCIIPLALSSQEQVTLVHNETLPGISMPCVAMALIPENATGVIDLYIDYNRDNNLEEDEKIESIAFTAQDVNEDPIFCFIVRTPPSVTEPTTFLAMVRVRIFLDSNLIREHILRFHIALEPFTRIDAILARVKGLISRRSPFGIATSVISKIDASLEALARENFKAAINQLGAAINELEAIRGKLITKKRRISTRLSNAAIQIFIFVQQAIEDTPDPTLAVLSLDQNTPNQPEHQALKDGVVEKDKDTSRVEVKDKEDLFEEIDQQDGTCQVFFIRPCLREAGEVAIFAFFASNESYTDTRYYVFTLNFENSWLFTLGPRQRRYMIVKYPYKNIDARLALKSYCAEFFDKKTALSVHGQLKNMVENLKKLLTRHRLKRTEIQLQEDRLKKAIEENNEQEIQARLGNIQRLETQDDSILYDMMTLNNQILNLHRQGVNFRIYLHYRGCALIQQDLILFKIKERMKQVFEKIHENREEDPGLKLYVNNDDDNENDVKDLDEEIVEGEDDLAQVWYFWARPIENTGHIRDSPLKISTNSDKIKFWRKQEKMQLVDLTAGSPKFVSDLFKRERMFIEATEASEVRLGEDIKTTFSVTILVRGVTPITRYCEDEGRITNIERQLSNPEKDNPDDTKQGLHSENRQEPFQSDGQTLKDKFVQDKDRSHVKLKDKHRKNDKEIKIKTRSNDHKLRKIDSAKKDKENKIQSRDPEHRKIHPAKKVIKSSTSYVNVKDDKGSNKAVIQSNSLEAQGADVTLVDNETLPGITLLCFQLIGELAENTTGVIDLYVDYDGDFNFELEEKIQAIPFTQRELKEDNLFCFVVKTPSFVTEPTWFQARARVRELLNGNVIGEASLIFWLRLEPFTTVIDILTRVKAVISRFFPDGTATSVNSKIDASIAALDRENFRSAENTLGAAINELEAVRGKEMGAIPISSSLSDASIEILRFVKEPAGPILELDTRRDFVFGPFHSEHGVPILFRPSLPLQAGPQPKAARKDHEGGIANKGVVEFYSRDGEGVKDPKTGDTLYGRENFIIFWPVKAFDSNQVAFIQLAQRDAFILKDKEKEKIEDERVSHPFVIDAKIDLEKGLLLPTMPNIETQEPRTKELKELLKTGTQASDFPEMTNPWRNVPEGTKLEVNWLFITWIYNKNSADVWTPIGYYRHSLTVTLTTGKNTATDVKITPPAPTFTVSDGKGQGEREVQLRQQLEAFIERLRAMLATEKDPDKKRELEKAIEEAKNFVIR